MSILSLIRSRIFIALLVLGVALVVAAACGDDDDGDEAPPQGRPPSTPLARRLPLARPQLRLEPPWMSGCRSSRSTRRKTSQMRAC